MLDVLVYTMILQRLGAADQFTKKWAVFQSELAFMFSLFWRKLAVFSKRYLAVMSVSQSLSPHLLWPKQNVRRTVIGQILLQES